MILISSTATSGNDMWLESPKSGSAVEFSYPCSVALYPPAILARVADHSTGDPRIWEKSI